MQPVIFLGKLDFSCQEYNYDNLETHGCIVLEECKRNNQPKDN